MNNFRFSPPPRTALLLAGVFLLTLNLIMSCRDDAAELREPQTPGDVAVTLRAPCTDTGLCDCAITAYSNATLNLCGDITYATTGCAFGCNPSTDVGISGDFIAYETRNLCVTPPANLCIYNPSTTTSVTVEVSFGGTTPQIVTIPPSDRRCFSTSAQCDVTDIDCY